MDGLSLLELGLAFAAGIVLGLFIASLRIPVKPPNRHPRSEKQIPSNDPADWWKHDESPPWEN